MTRQTLPEEGHAGDRLCEPSVEAARELAISRSEESIYLAANRSACSPAPAHRSVPSLPSVLFPLPFFLLSAISLSRSAMRFSHPSSPGR